MADTGATLDEVVRVTKKANFHTRTLGVGFAGCTLPGANEPLFTVPEWQKWKSAWAYMVNPE